MKKLYLLIFSLLFTTFVTAQIVNIPDINFKNALIEENVDSNNDGEIQITEAEAITSLNLFFKNISSLEGIEAFTNINYLDCADNQLTALDVSQNTNLTQLSCWLNQITSLDISSNQNITFLECENNQLTSLIISQNSNLTNLSCYSNQLTNLDVSQCTSLTNLNCYDNQLTTINLSQTSSLLYLDCYENQLTTIDLSESPNLLYLECWENQLTSLDVMQNPNLNHIGCEINQLTSLYLKNGNINEILAFYDNPDLEYICADAGEVSSIQEDLDAFNFTNCVVNSYCSFTPGGSFYTITGQTAFDSNNNGCDTDDSGYPNMKFTISDGTNSGNAIANSFGEYSLHVQEGSHTITPVFENPDYFTVTPTSLVVDFPADTSPYTQDFCITPNGVFNDVEISLLPIDEARPGFDTNYKLVYKNKGTTTLSGTIDLIFNDDVMDFVNASPSESIQSTGTLSWNYVNLEPFETRFISFTMGLNTPTDPDFPLNGDDLIWYSSSINPISGDETTGDNVFRLNQTVVNSFDPNDKTCLQGTTITPEQVGEYVSYMIRFENTGTANAINIVVKDVIDETKYDVTSLIPIDASHPFYSRINNGNNVEFIFENIQLPFDDANNDGYISFKIKTLSTLVEGDIFKNMAEIYFDYNAPIITNEYETIIETKLGIDKYELDESISLYPKPTTGTITIEAKTKLKTIIVYNINGRLVQSTAVIGNKNKTQLNISTLNPGLYFVKIVSHSGTFVDKLIKK